MSEEITQITGEFAFVIGKLGAGLWLPGACVPLLIAHHSLSGMLQAFADGLPIMGQTAGQIPETQKSP